MFLTLVVIASFLTVLYIYLKRVYFTLNGPIPGLPPQFLIGNLWQTGFIGKNIPLNVIFSDLKEKFGDIFQFWLGPSRIVLVNCLEDIQHIFSNRHIYEQADLFTEKLSLINPFAILVLTGLNIK